MTPDPHGVLGVPAGASTAEIKRAYRRLAKEFHPDAAGEEAIPRFLAIQAAYEALVGPPSGRPGEAGTRRREPWWADAQRARATRDAYRRRGTGGGPKGGGEPAGGPATEPGSRRRRRAGGGHGQESSGQAAGSAGRDGSAARGPGGRTRSDRPSNRARPGSTTYDGAEAEPLDPGWSGASWYGASSGTYWTVNPREYADPRKHGPEYQARGRRRPADEDPADRASPGNGDGRGDGGSAAGDSGADEVPPFGPATAARDRPEEPAPNFRGRSRFEHRRPPPDSATADLEAAASLGRLLAAAPRSGVGRGLMALTGWPPVGVAAAVVIGEVTGCARFSATCNGAAGWALAAQAAILLLLVLVPRLGVAATAGTFALLAVALPAAVLLSIAGGARDPQGAAAALAGLLAVAWLVGVGLALFRLRPVPAGDEARVP